MANPPPPPPKLQQYATPTLLPTGFVTELFKCFDSGVHIGFITAKGPNKNK
jgi:hypothetical protein